jgi:hypothetical protein
MYLVKAVMQGIGETLYLRYNLRGEAEKIFELLKHRQFWQEGSTDFKPVTEEIDDDHGVTAVVPAAGILFVQMIDLEKFTAADARQNIAGQLAMQKEVNKVQAQPPIISPQPGTVFRQ